MGDQGVGEEGMKGIKEERGRGRGEREGKVYAKGITADYTLFKN